MRSRRNAHGLTRHNRAITHAELGGCISHAARCIRAGRILSCAAVYNRTAPAVGAVPMIMLATM